MTDDERRAEGLEEPIEDLEAPAAAQGDVAGGNCATPTCLGTRIRVFCDLPTCRVSAQYCDGASQGIVVYDH
jgi:hypothetical protein